MEVSNSRPPADLRYARKLGWEEPDLQVALRERAREVAAAARETVAHSLQLKSRLGETVTHSFELKWLSGGWKEEETLTSRCAWCRRYQVGERWLDAGAIAAIPASRTSHTICDDCTRALRESGLSA